MNLTIDISEQNAALLEAQAKAARMPTERYLTEIVEHAIERQRRHAAERLARHIDEMATHILPEATPEDMEAAIEEALEQVRPPRAWRK